MDEHLLSERDDPRRKSVKGVSLEDQSSWLGKWTFSFLNPLFALGLTKDLVIEDLGEICNSDKCSVLYDRFQAHWEKELLKPRTKISLWNALWRTARYRNLIFAVALFALYAGLTFVPVLVLSVLVSHFEGNRDLTLVELWSYVAAMFVVPMLASFMQSQSNAILLRMATHIRNALINAIFRKALRLSPDSRQEQSTGKIINMFANDTKQIQMFLFVVNNMIVAPFQIAVILYLIYLQVGVAAFAGLGYMALIFPFNGVMLRAVNKTRKVKMVSTDARVKLMNEVLNGIRVIKYYAWEAPFREKISEIRKIEARYLKRIAYISAIGFSLLFFATPIVLPIIIFYTYIQLGNTLDASTAFTTIVLFSMLLMPFALLPYGIIQYLQSRVSANRISEFLVSHELQGYVNKHKLGKLGMLDEGVVIKFVSANIRWVYQIGPDGNYDSSRLMDATRSTQHHIRSHRTLIDINLIVQRGDLVAIVGAVGSGKTSLLNAVLGETYVDEASAVSVLGSIAYCEQRPWILNATVESNILFGVPKEERRLQEALRVSCLDDDLKIMPAGIQTEIGERGINLSGGQKARVSLARAVYADADIYILDDPLAAVDAHVGQQIFENCIKTALKGKTRLLVTHQLHLLRECDNIIVLENGFIKAQGSFDSLSRSGIDLEAIIPIQKVAEDNLDANISSTDGTHMMRKRSYSSGHMDSEADNERLLSHESVISTTSRILSIDREIPVDELDRQGPKTTKSGGDLMTAEELATGNVDLNVYWVYIKAGGLKWSVAIVLLMIGVQACNLGSSFYLTYWSSESTDREDHDNPMSNSTNLKYMGVFAAVSLGGVLFLLARGIVLAQIQLNASIKLHGKLLDRVLAAPISFFDITPLGRIVNRFSSDMSTIDEMLSQSISQTTNSLFGVFGALVAIALATKGVLLLLLAPLSLLYYNVQQTFRKTNTTIARLESVTRSPIYADFSELLGGLTTIRAYNEGNTFIQKVETALDINTVPTMLQVQAGYWLGIRLDAMGALITFFVAFIAVASDTFLKPYLGNNFISAGYLALGLNYSFVLTTSLKFCIRVGAQLEAQMNTVERVKYYSENIDQEVEIQGNVAARLDPDWPVEGRIEGRNVEMKYREGPLVLKGLNFTILKGEKIGIAGRTGSGKSSLMNALFRIQELSGGQILIDGVDTKLIPLSIIRSRVGIIPQDPVMFSASIRFNLDPFQRHTDEELWDILDQVDMRNHIRTLSGGLEEEVAEGGDNFSAGQRQLICIGRALLRHPKILVLDEATASIDNVTDDLIQKVIRRIFEQSTVLTIAHRLNTIIDSDRIMVLDDGRLGEMGPAETLLKQSSGLFKSLWENHKKSHVED